MMTTNVIDNQELVFNAALDMFAEHGYHGFSIRQLARQLNVSIGTIQYHIGSKDEIYKAIFRQVFEEESRMLSEHLAKITPDIYTDREKLIEWLVAYNEIYTRYYHENSNKLRIWVTRYNERAEIFPEMEREFSQPMYQQVYDVFSDIRKTGAICFSDVDLETWLLGITWLFTGFLFFRNRLDYDQSQQQITGQDIVKFQDLWERYLEILLPPGECAE